MTEKLRQSLSAAIDDEADAFELRRVIDELGRDEELRRLWDRYHLIGNALRGERAALSNGMRERIWEALETAPAAAAEIIPLPDDAAVEDAAVGMVAQAPEAARSRRGRYMALAVAATVAFAVVIGFNAVGPSDTHLPEIASVEAPTAVVTPVVASPAGGGSARPEAVLSGGEISPRDVRRAQAYMLHHAQQQALNQAGVMSFVKLATYEAP